MKVKLGSERLLASGMLRGKRVGVVANPASLDASLRHVVEAVAAQPGVTLGAVFGPQHGARCDVQDNMVETGHGRDEARRVPVYSLYSETREPTAQMLEGLDALVIDLQDVGTRIYTYVYTMANCLRAARKRGLKVYLCDRPNPIGGEAVEGPMLRAGFESFVGQFPIPMRHGMTIGELARLFNERFGLGADLEVVPMEGWRRAQWFDETGLTFVLTSPNMPTLDSATVFPGTVLYEGTNLSEGRGTTRPFELVGAPWVADPERLARRLNGLKLPGAFFRPIHFEPTFQKHAKQVCGGCQIHVLDRRAFRPVQTGVAVLLELRREGEGRFQWRAPPYEYEERLMPIDILAGSDQLRLGVDADKDAAQLAREWEPETAAFKAVRRSYLLYE